MFFLVIGVTAAIGSNATTIDIESAAMPAFYVVLAGAWLIRTPVTKRNLAIAAVIFVLVTIGIYYWQLQKAATIRVTRATGHVRRCSCHIFIFAGLLAFA